MDFEKCNHKVPEAPAPSPAVDPAEVARDDFTEYYMKEFGHPGLTPKKYQTIASYGVEFHGKNEVLDARFKYEGYNYPAPAPDYSERPHRMDVNYYLHKNSNSGPGERIGQYDSWRELLSAAQRWFKTEPGTLYYFSPSGDGELRRSDVERQLEKSTIPAPAPKGGYAIGFGKSEKDWRNMGLAADLYAEAKAIKANGGNIDTPRYSVRRENAGKSIHDLSPYEELLYMTGLYFTGGKIGLAILYGTAAQEVEKLFDGDNVRKYTDLSQFYSQSPAPSPLPKCSGGDAQDG